MTSPKTLIATLGVGALLVAGAVLPRVGEAAPAASGPSGAYAFSFTGHDPTSSEDIVGAGSIVFSGSTVTAEWGEENVTPPSTRDVLTVSFTGTLVLRSDGSTDIDGCVSAIDNTVPLTPFPLRLTGAFSNAFKSFRLIDLLVGGAACGSTATGTPNAVVSWTGEKL